MIALTSEALLSTETARHVVALAISAKTSVQIDADEEFEKIDSEAEQREEDKAKEQAELAQKLYLASMAKGGVAAPPKPGAPEAKGIQDAAQGTQAPGQQPQGEGQGATV
jgi:hypothetical protein